MEMNIRLRDIPVPPDGQLRDLVAKVLHPTWDTSADTLEDLLILLFKRIPSKVVRDDQ